MTTQLTLIQQVLEAHQEAIRCFTGSSIGPLGLSRHLHRSQEALTALKQQAETEPALQALDELIARLAALVELLSAPKKSAETEPECCSEWKPKVGDFVCMKHNEQRFKVLHENTKYGPDHPDYLLENHGWEFLHNLEPAPPITPEATPPSDPFFQKILEKVKNQPPIRVVQGRVKPPEANPPPGCIINPSSPLVCNRGTKGCNAEHENVVAPEAKAERWAEEKQAWIAGRTVQVRAKKKGSDEWFPWEDLASHRPPSWIDDPCVEYRIKPTDEKWAKWGDVKKRLFLQTTDDQPQQPPEVGVERNPCAIEAGHPEEKCDDCGGFNVVWFAPNELWNNVVREGKDAVEREGDPMICPRCFALRCAQQGINPVWQFAPKDWQAKQGLVEIEAPKDELAKQHAVMEKVMAERDTWKQRAIIAEAERAFFQKQGNDNLLTLEIELKRLTERAEKAKVALEEAKEQVATLELWKSGMLQVESWWKQIDDYVRAHPDALVGDSVSSLALKWLKERDTLAKQVEMDSVRFKEMQDAGLRLEVELEKSRAEVMRLMKALVAAAESLAPTVQGDATNLIIEKP